MQKKKKKEKEKEKKKEEGKEEKEKERKRLFREKSLECASVGGAMRVRCEIIKKKSEKKII